MSHEKPISETTSASEAAPQRKRRWLRIIVVLLALILLLVLLAPTIVSSGPGTDAVVAIANRFLPGSIAIDDLRIGWFASTRVAGFTLADPDHNTVVSAAELSLADKSLLSLLRSSDQLGAVNGRDINIDLVRYADGSTNLQRALPAGSNGSVSSSSSSPPSSSPSQLSADVQLQNVRLSLQAPDIESVQVDVPKLHVTIAGLDRIDLDIAATIKQGNLGGSILATGGISGASGGQPQVNLQTKLDALPVAAVDQLLNFDGKLAALLGDKLDGSVEVTGTQRDAQLQLTARSSTLDVNLPLRLTETQLTVGNGAQIALALQPSAYQAWVGTGQLAGPVTLHVGIERLVLPMQDGKPDASKLEAAVKLNTDALALTVPQLGALRIEQLAGNIAVDRTSDTAQLSLQGPFALDGQPGNLQLAVRVDQFSDASARRFDVTLQDLPVALVDQIAQQNGRAVALVGQTATLSAAGQYPGDIDIKLNGDNLSLHAPLSLTSEAYALSAPANLQCTLSPASYALLAGEQAGTLQQPFTLTANMKQLFVPLIDGKPDLANLRADADISATPIVADVPQVGLMRVEALAGSLHADRATDSAKLTMQSPLSVGEQAGKLDVSAELAHLSAAPYQLNVTLADLPMPLIDQLAGQGGKMLKLVGNTATATATGAYPGDLKLTFTSPRLNIDAPLRLDEYAYALSAPAHVQWELRPGAYRVFVGEESGTLRDNATFEADISELVLPLADGKPDLTKLRAAATLQATPITVQVPQLGLLQIQSLRGSVRADRESDSAKITLASPLLIKDQPSGALDIAAEVAHLSAQPYRIDVKIADLPVPLVDQLLKQAGKATALVGNTATLTMAGAYPGDLKISFRSSDLSLDAPLRLSETAYTLTSPATVKLQLDPADYLLLMGDKAGTLTKPMTVSATITQATLPLIDGKVDSTKLKAAATLQSTTIALDMPNVGLMQIDSLNGSLVTDRSTDTAHLLLKGPISTGDQRGDLDIDAKLTSTADGPPYNVDAKLTNVPMPLIDQLGGLNGQATALIGPTATAAATGQFPGAVLFTLRSRDLQADAPLQIDENNLVTLKKDFTAQLMLNEEAARTVLGKVHPAIADVIASNKPVKLLIRSEGFQVPLNEFAFEKVKAKGVLDLGELKMTRRGWMTKLMDTIASHFGQAPQQGTDYVAQFTPANFVVANGRIRTDEMWMTSGNLAIGFQGRADVPGDQYDFQMGILGATLISQVSALSKVYQPDEVETIPLKGSLNRPVPEIMPILIAIGKKLGLKQLQEQGGDLGSILGGIGQKISERDKDKVSWTLPTAAEQIVTTLTQQSQTGEPTGTTETTETDTTKPKLTPEEIRQRRQERREKQQNQQTQQ